MTGSDVDAPTGRAVAAEGGRPRARVAVVAAFAAAGLVFAVGATASRGTDLRADRVSDLRDLVAREAARTDAASARTSSLRDEVDALAATSGGGAALDAARAAAAALEAVAGAAPLTGPGVTVTLDDAATGLPGSDKPGLSPDDLVIHQQDVQAVVNALWRGGARGVGVMDQRLLATSAVRCVGNTLILGGRVYSPPFRITAVGDTAALTAALEDDPSVRLLRDLAAVVGLGYAVAPVDRVTLPAGDPPRSGSRVRVVPTDAPTPPTPTPPGTPPVSSPTAAATS